MYVSVYVVDAVYVPPVTVAVAVSVIQLVIVVVSVSVTYTYLWARTSTVPNNITKSIESIRSLTNSLFRLMS